jgi:hypothetical protein
VGDLWWCYQYVPRVKRPVDTGCTVETMTLEVDASTEAERSPVPKTTQSIVIALLAAGGVALFAAYVVTAGLASLDNPDEPVVLRPPELVGFGVAAGALLAANLGAVLGIGGLPTNRASIQKLADATQAPLFQIGGAVVYLGLLGVAFGFYWASDWSQNAADVIRSSMATLSGVLLGAMAAAFATKPDG